MESYVKDAENFYEAPVKSLDFGANGKAFQDEVNEWVRTKTKVNDTYLFKIISHLKIRRSESIITKLVHCRGK